MLATWALTCFVSPGDCRDAREKDMRAEEGGHVGKRTIKFRQCQQNIDVRILLLLVMLLFDKMHCLTLNFLLKNIKVPIPVLSWLISN